MHLNIFTEICDMMCIKDVNPHVVKLRLFPFSLRGKAKEWLLSLPRGTITTWDNCCSLFMMKFYPPAKTMQLRSKIIVQSDTAYMIFMVKSVMQKTATTNMATKL